MYDVLLRTELILGVVLVILGNIWDYQHPITRTVPIMTGGRITEMEM